MPPGRRNKQELPGDRYFLPVSAPAPPATRENMKRKKAYLVSNILTGLGVILALLPFFGFGLPQQQGFLFASLLCFLAAFMFRQLGEEEKEEKK
jgi:hypothetical protein